jgi:hypothetical protein
MASINIREARRAANPPSKYDGTSSFDDYRTPVAYTADDLMRQIVKREKEKQQAAMAEADESPSYLENMMPAVAANMDTSIYDKYKPEREYSFAERLALLKNASPENRMAILELTAPQSRKMKKGFGAISEALLPAMAAGITHANAKKQEHEALKRIARQQRATEEAKEGRRLERDYIKQLLKKEAAIDTQRMKAANNERLEMLKIAAKGNQESGGIKTIGNESFRGLNKKEQEKANEAKALANDTYLKSEEVIKNFKDLDKESKDNWFHPFGAASTPINYVKDTIGNVFGVKSLQDEAVRREEIISELGKLRTTAERLNTGTNGIAQGMYDRLSKYFPSERDSLPVLRRKLDNFHREIEEAKKIANIKADYGIHYDAGDLARHHPRKEKKEVTPEKPSNEDTVKMTAPDGQVWNVPASNVLLFKKHKFK